MRLHLLELFQELASPLPLVETEEAGMDEVLPEVLPEAHTGMKATATLACPARMA